MADYEALAHAAWESWTDRRVDSDRGTMPTALWHYTTAGGMQGILSSERMWFTDTRFLNDAAEIQYGVDFFVEQLKSLDLSTYKSETITILEKLNKTDWRTFRDNLATRSAAYVSCFCAEGDLLSQWRTYGVGAQREVGYSLGFESRDFHGWVQSAAPTSEDMFLRRVDYDPGSQAATAVEIIRDLVRVLDQEPLDVSAREAFVEYILRATVQFAAACKHPTFSEEKEWRIIIRWYAEGAPSDLKFRHNQGMIVPYREVSLPEPTGAHAGHLPVKRIRFGPSTDPARVEVGLRSLIASYEHFAHIEIDGTTAPLRV